MVRYSVALYGTLLPFLGVPLSFGIPRAVAQDDFVSQARALKAKGDVDGAIALLQQGLATDPDNSSAHYVLGWAYAAKGEKAKATAAFWRVVQLSPDGEEGREAKAALERMGAGPKPEQVQAVGRTDEPVDLPRLGPRPRVTGPAARITTDPVRTCPLVDGEAFFAIGCYDVPPEQMQLAAEAGFNLTVRWGSVSQPNTLYAQALAQGSQAAGTYLRRYLDAAQSNGLWVLETPMLFTAESLSYQDSAFAVRFDRFMGERLPQVLDAVRDHPALFGYYGPDEFGCAPQVKDQVGRFTHVVRERDAQHPIVLLTTAYEDWLDVLGAGGWAGWDATVDIAATDWYPIPGQQSYVMGARCAGQNAALARSASHAFWWVPLVNWAWDAKPYPLSPRAQRVQVYLALIGGANGIVWWMWPPRHVDQWETIRRVNQEVGALAPVLLEPLTRTQVIWDPPELADTVQVRAIRHNGHTWLLTANASAVGADVRISLPTTASQARVWFEDREVGLEAGALTDGFEGFECHTYEVAGTWPEDAPIRIEVSPDAPPTEYGPWPGPGFRVSEENLLRDPGFEDPALWEFRRGTWSSDYAKGYLDLATPFRGARSAVIERLADPVVAVWDGPMVELQPHTRYLFGGYARNEAPYPSEAEIQLLQLHETHVSGLQVLHAEPASPWTRYSGLFAVGEGQANDGRLLAKTCVAMDVGLGRAAFDDLFLYEACVGIRNLIANGGFEGTEVAKGWPTNWCETESLDVPGHIGSDDPPWGVDHSVAYEGSNSFRMVHTGYRHDPERGTRGYPRLCQFLLPGTVIPKDQPYVFSAYMKSDRPDLLVQAQLTYGRGCQQDLRIGTEWERHVVRITPEQPLSQPFVALVLLRQGTLWVDAVQFEPGTEPTDYQEWWY